MADITADDVTVSIGSRDKNFAQGGASKNMTIASITFGDGALTYPTGGVPMPAIGHFGMHLEMDMMVMESSANGFHYKYDRTNHTMKIFTQGVTTGSTGVSPGSTGALIEDSAAAEGLAELLGGSPDTTYDLGAMIELPATITPAEVTLRALVIGE